MPYIIVYDIKVSYHIISYHIISYHIVACYIKVNIKNLYLDLYLHQILSYYVISYYTILNEVVFLSLKSTSCKTIDINIPSTSHFILYNKPIPVIAPFLSISARLSPHRSTPRAPGWWYTNPSEKYGSSLG